MRSFAALAATLALAAALGCSASSYGGPGGGGCMAGTGNGVSVCDNHFSPTAITVAAGTTVTWTWRGANQHGVVFSNGGFAASPVQSTGTFTTVFPTGGGLVFNYQCAVHGAAMPGSITVQ